MAAAGRSCRAARRSRGGDWSRLRRGPIARPRSSHRKKSAAPIARFDVPLALIASCSGRVDTTALKLPLVPSTQPRA
jgi:hypothetical protein